MTDSQNLTVLNNLGFPISNRVTSYDSSINTFFSWLSDNIDEENVLSNQELFEYNVIKNNGEVIDQDEINRQLEKYPNVLEIAQDDIDQLEMKLNKKILIKKQYDDLGNSLQHAVNNLHVELKQTEDSLISFDYLNKKYYTEVIENTNQVLSLQSKSQTKLKEIEKYYYNLLAVPIFIFQFNQNECIGKIKQFYAFCDLYMQKNFKTSIECSARNQTTAAPFENYVKKFEKIRKRIYIAQKNNLNNEMKMETQRKTIDGISKYQIVSIDYNDIENQLAIYAKEFEQHNNHLNILCNDLSKLLSQSCDQFIESILIDLNSNKIIRAEKRLKSIHEIHKSSTTVFDVAEILWILMQIDSKCFRNLEMESKYDKHIEQADGFNRRNTILKAIAGNIGDVKNNISQKGKKLRSNVYETIDKINWTQESWNINKINKLVNFIVSDSNYSEINAIDYKLTSKCAQLSQFLNDGPFNKVQLCDLKNSQIIYEITENLIEATKTARNIRMQFRSSIIERMESDKHWRYDQLFWIWFLTSPTKVLNVISEIKKKAENNN